MLSSQASEALKPVCFWIPPPTTGRGVLGGEALRHQPLVSPPAPGLFQMSLTLQQVVHLETKTGPDRNKKVPHVMAFA